MSGPPFATSEPIPPLANKPLLSYFLSYFFSKRPHKLETKLTEKMFVFRKKDGTPWLKPDVLKVLGKRVVTNNPNQIICICMFDESHKRAELRIEYNAAVSYYCHACNVESGDEFNAQLARFQAWLEKHELVDGRWKPHQNPFNESGDSPTLSLFNDIEGQPILYNGAIHLLYGKPGTLKSWVALSTLKDYDVRIWDFENGKLVARDRLTELGVGADRANGYDVPNSREAVLERVKEYRATKPDLLCIDGFSGLADVLGVNAENNAEVASVYGDVFFPLKEEGVAVLVLDHLPKDSASDDFPIGAQNKKAQADVAFLAKNQARANLVDLYVAKDRHGELLARSEPGAFPRKFASIELNTSEKPFQVQVIPAYQPSLNGVELPVSKANLMKKIMEFVENNPGSSKGAIEEAVIGKNDRIRTSVSYLVENGYLKVKTIGPSHLHSVAKPLEINWNPFGNQLMNG